MKEIVDDVQWFYMKAGAQRGPIDETDLSRLIETGALPPDTPVLQKGLAEWTAANATGQFASIQVANSPVETAFSRPVLWALGLGLMLALSTGAALMILQSKKHNQAIHQKESELAGLKKKFNLNASALDQRAEEIDRWKKDGDAKDLENKTLKDLREEVNTQLGLAQSELETLRAKAAALQQDMQNKNTKLTQKSADAAEAKQLLVALQKQAKDLETQLQTMAKEIQQLQAELATAKSSPWKIEGTTPESDIKYNLNTGQMTATGGVRVEYHKGAPDAAEMTSDSGTLNRTTGDIVATGNVILRREGNIWKAERMEYNFRTRNIKSAQFRTGNLGQQSAAHDKPPPSKPKK